MSEGLQGIARERDLGMPSDTVLNVLSGLAGQRALAPVILIAGQNAFLREYVLGALTRRLSAEGFSYRSIQVSAAADLSALVDELGGADLFASKRMIACRVLRSYRERAGADDSAGEDNGPSARGTDSAIAEIIAQAKPPNHLLMLYERDNAPAKVRRAAETAGLVINCPRPFDNQLPRYAQLFAQAEGLAISTRAAETLVSRHGGDLGALANVLSRLAITAEPGATIDVGDLNESGSARLPELFEIAESLAAGRAAASIAQLSRALASGRDPVEILSVEIVPALRRMMTAAAMLAQRKGTPEIAAAMGFGPSSPLAARAIEGARRFGLARLTGIYQRAAALDTDFKNGRIKGRAEALSALVLDLMAKEERPRAGR